LFRGEKAEVEGRLEAPRIDEGVPSANEDAPPKKAKKKKTRIVDEVRPIVSMPWTLYLPFLTSLEDDRNVSGGRSSDA
jgi:hypothetical protein